MTRARRNRASSSAGEKHLNRQSRTPVSRTLKEGEAQQKGLIPAMPSRGSLCSYLGDWCRTFACTLKSSGTQLKMGNL